MNTPENCTALNNSFNTQNQWSALLARSCCHGPLHYGEMTVFVFRGLQSNDKSPQIIQMDDRGLASGEGGSMEVDMNQLDPDDMKTSAQHWYAQQLAQGNLRLCDNVAVVFDGARTYSPELYGEANRKALAARFDRDTQPGWWQRTKQTLQGLRSDNKPACQCS